EAAELRERAGVAVGTDRGDAPVERPLAGQIGLRRRLLPLRVDLQRREKTRARHLEDVAGRGGDRLPREVDLGLARGEDLVVGRRGERRRRRDFLDRRERRLGRGHDLLAAGELDRLAARGRRDGRRAFRRDDGGGLV